MPLPSTLNARNLAAIFDANEQSLGWVKDLTETPLSSSNTIPSEQLIALPLGKNEVVVCYGEKHPLHNEDSRNIAYFDALLQVSDFGTTLEYTGARPIEPPIEHWKACSLRWSMGGTGIHDDNRQLEWLQQDQVFATTLLQKVLESYGDGKMKFSRPFLLRKKGTQGRDADHFIGQFEPLYGERQARTDLAGAGGSGSGGQPSPRKRSTQTLPESQTSSSPSTSKVSTTPLPSPRKRGSALKKNENKSTPPATPVQIVLDRIPKVAGAPGILYPASAIRGFRPNTFTSPSRLHSIQLAIFDENGNTILPANTPGYLSPGAVVRARLAFGCWKSTDGPTLRPFIRIGELYVLAKAEGNDIEDGEVISDSEKAPSLLGAEDDSPIKNKGKASTSAKLLAKKLGLPDLYTISNPAETDIFESEDLTVGSSKPKEQASVSSTVKNPKSILKKVDIVEIQNTDEEVVPVTPAPAAAPGKRGSKKRKHEEPEAGPSNIKKRRITRASRK